MSAISEDAVGAGDVSPGIKLPLFREEQARGAATAPPSGRAKRVSVLGATGSIGASSYEVLAAHRERFEVVSLVGDRNVDRMVALAHALSPQYVAMRCPHAAAQVAAQVTDPKPEVLSGEQGVIEAASAPCDIAIAAITGFAGLRPTLAAIEGGADIALANKESMVCAGPFVLDAARKAGVNILPVDSEHSALFQCLVGQDLAQVQSLVLTASGGPFRALSPAELGGVTVDQALAHPNWSMGSKVTIDSATLMNKGLELIEAKWLFDAAPQQMHAVIHPSSTIHSLVQYADGSFLAQAGVPTMITPVAVALGWPNRLDLSHHAITDGLEDPASALVGWTGLQFQSIDPKRFPCFGLARQAMTQGQGACVVLNASNEIAVADFLAGEIGFTDIAARVEGRLAAADNSGVLDVRTLDDVFALDEWSRQS